jgi:hypothetical protein
MTIFAAEKRMYISCPLFLEYFIFLPFSIFVFLTSLKNNKMLLRYKGGMSVTRKKIGSKSMEHTDAQGKETCAG